MCRHPTSGKKTGTVITSLEMRCVFRFLGVASIIRPRASIDENVTDLQSWKKVSGRLVNSFRHSILFLPFPYLQNCLT